MRILHIKIKDHKMDILYSYIPGSPERFDKYSGYLYEEKLPIVDVHSVLIANCEHDISNILSDNIKILIIQKILEKQNDNRTTSAPSSSVRR
jgi:hypothetical protein